MMTGANLNPFSILHLHARVCRARSKRSHACEESPPGRAKDHNCHVGENTKSTGKRDGGEEKYRDAAQASAFVAFISTQGGR